MESNTITALATGLLVIVGFFQVEILIAQRRQIQLELIEEYRKRWAESRKSWGAVIFIGRDENEYYQVVDKDTIKILASMRDKANWGTPTVWALDATRSVFTTLSDISTKILQNQLKVSNVYPLFGTELLRHGRPLRVLLENNYHSMNRYPENTHQQVRNEVQDWLIYHDGIRRRCLILIDLLWAEAARLEDLPPSDLKIAADAKISSGKFNRRRLIKECIRLNGFNRVLLALKLSRFMRNSEYRRFGSRIGIDKKRLAKLEKEWTERLLRDYK